MGYQYENLCFVVGVKFFARTHGDLGIIILDAQITNGHGINKVVLEMEELIVLATEVAEALETLLRLEAEAEAVVGKEVLNSG